MRDERIEEAMGSVSSGVNMYTVAVGVVVNVDVYLDVDIDRSRGEDQSSSKGGLGYEMASGRGRRSGKRQVKGVRHERKGVSVGIGGSKDVVDGGLVMERGIDKVLGNLIRWSTDSRPVWRTHKRNIVQLRPFGSPYGHPSPMLCVPGISKFFGPFEGLNAVQVLISQSSEALLKVVVEIFRVFEFVLPSTSVECDPGAVNEVGNFQLFRLSAESFDP
ncbi:hypothetical protein C359_02647 [Cryptococcus neoformans Bt120]|nr:hypothetical protein C360_04700 [Cryptococcus neoformans var. grubii Bt15]OXG42059.1 hypothetical protein C359_02647 [Cryptococcus neoformans var. grubii Bt120]